MATKKYLDSNGLLYYNQKVKATYQPKQEGKGLSTNDYTTAEKNKLAGLNNYELQAATANQLGGVKVGAGLSINNGVLSATGGGTADSVDWSNVQNKPTIPTNNNQLTNGAGYQNATQVQSAINSALDGFTGVDYQVVSNLPSTGTKGIIYLVSNGGANPNVYDEYIYINNTFEKIGTTAVDLTDYVTNEDLESISNTEIDTILAS